MVSNADRILPTELYAPHPRPDLVERLRLTTHLNDGIRQEQRLFLCAAPAGYGETPLIATWLYDVVRLALT